MINNPTRHCTVLLAEEYSNDPPMTDHRQIKTLINASRSTDSTGDKNEMILGKWSPSDHKSLHQLETIKIPHMSPGNGPLRQREPLSQIKSALKVHYILKSALKDHSPNSCYYLVTGVGGAH